MKWEELTPEQKEQLYKTMVVASKSIIDAFEKVFAAMQPSLDLLKEFYDSLPQDVKQDLAALQVEEKLKENRQ